MLTTLPAMPAVASAAEIMDLARSVRAAVRAKFAVELDIEPTLVGLAP